MTVFPDSPPVLACAPDAAMDGREMVGERLPATPCHAWATIPGPPVAQVANPLTPCRAVPCMVGDPMLPVRLPGVARLPLAVRDGRVRVAERELVVVGIVLLPVATMVRLTVLDDRDPAIPSGV